MIDQHTIARERYLASIDALIIALGKHNALWFMRQATSAVGGNPSPMSIKRLHDHAVSCAGRVVAP